MSSSLFQGPSVTSSKGQCLKSCALDMKPSSQWFRQCSNLTLPPVVVNGGGVKCVHCSSKIKVNPEPQISLSQASEQIATVWGLFKLSDDHQALIPPWAEAGLPVPYLEPKIGAPESLVSLSSEFLGTDIKSSLRTSHNRTSSILHY